jgi:2,3-bisphosphoglycerate-dependent phosphoglycerate mutase
MKSKSIVFARHGESFDDIYNEFGAWSDRALTPQGILTAYVVSRAISRLKSFDIIYTSPLRRATETAQIIGEEMNLRVEEDKYLIERNTYGLLAGLNHDIAIAEYPELNAAFLEGKYIHGAERYGAFQLRIARLIERLITADEDSIICITHGYVITEIIDTYLGKVRNSLGPGAIVEVQITEKLASDKSKMSKVKNQKLTQIDEIKRKYDLKIIYYENVTFTDDLDVINGLKFYVYENDRSTR